jgi:acyl carrier protein
MEQVLDRLHSVFHDTFQDDDIVLTRETTAADVDGWDSLMHVSLMLNVEAGFGIRFTSTEVAVLNSVGELIDLIRSKKGGAQ